jgi:putative ABC transport system ATP-binding protein
MIKLKNVTKKFGKHEVISNFNLEITEKELLCLSGPSGAGKTTLLNIMSLIEEPSSGTIEIDDNSHWSLSKKQQIRRNKFGYVFQNYGLIDNDSVQDNLLLTSKFVHKNKKEKLTIFEKSLAKVGLDGSYLSRKVYSLSGGEQQRVALARLFITKPKYIFADEPTGNLDQNNSELVFDILTKFSRNGSTVIYVSHDQSLIKRADRIVDLND